MEIVRLHFARIGALNDVPVHGFVIKHPREGAILVDTGVGWPTELVQEWKVVNRHAADALAEHDLSPADVRIVINSHLPFDHCGQNAVFPQAPFYVQRLEYERRQRYQDTPAAWLDFAAARDERLDGERESVPGVRVLTTPGHTPGHQSIEVDTTAGPALLTGDACWTVRMFGGEGAQEGMMEDVPTFHRSLDKLRRVKPSSIHFCHDTRTWRRPTHV